MKKALSYLLATIMIISAFAVMPATAAGTAPTAPDKEVVVGYDTGKVLEVSGLKEKVTATTPGTTPIPTVMDYSFTCTEGGKYTISSPEQLGMFSRMSRVTSSDGKQKWTFEGCTVYITCDIDMSKLEDKGDGTYSYNFSGIGEGNGSSAKQLFFAGTFDGQGYVIDNWEIANSYQGCGFFNCVVDATIKNVVLGSGNKVTASNNQIGGLVGYARKSNTAYGVSIENCLVMSTVVTNGNKNQMGGIIGAMAGPVDITNVTFGGSITGDNRVGGIVGAAGQVTTLTNCLMSGTVVANNASSTSSDKLTIGAGAIIGYLNNSATVNNCVNAGTVTSANVSGVIAGSINESSAAKLTVNSAVNYSTSVTAAYGKLGANATANISVYTDLSTADIGNAIRVNPDLPMGLRYTSVITKAQIDAAKALSKDGTVSFGTIIAPKDYFGTNEAYTATNAGTYLDIPATSIGMTENADGSVTLKAAITEIKDGNLKRDFVFVPYISYEDADGNTVYSYVYTTGIKSARAVADLALADTSASYSDTTIALIKERYVKD